MPDIIIWVDRDTYTRNDQKDAEKYARKPDNIPGFKFSYMNFEDFLAMHDDRHLAKWTSICNDHHNFFTPMHSPVYAPLFRREIFPDYKKGTLPSAFIIDGNSIKTLIANNRQAGGTIDRIHSDFASYLDTLLTEVNSE